MNKKDPLNSLARLKGLKENHTTRLENDLIKAVIEGDVNVRTYRQYKAAYQFIDGEEILLSRKFIHIYTERISLKGPVQRFSPYSANEKTELQLSNRREQTSQLYME